MDGFVGDVFKVFFAALVVFLLLGLAVLFYHFQQATHYEHEANEILQESPTVPAFYKQLHPNSGNSAEDKAENKLYHLDNTYHWIFAVTPQGYHNHLDYGVHDRARYDHHKSVRYGDPECYEVRMYLPMLINHNFYPRPVGNKLIAPHTHVYDYEWSLKTKMAGKTICELERENSQDSEYKENNTTHTVSSHHNPSLSSQNP